MTPQETNALLDIVSRLDTFVSNNPETFEVWQYALGGADYQQAAHVVKTYYANLDPSNRSPITPGYIRRTVSRENERAAAKRAALTRAPSRDAHPESWRSRNPAEWDRLKTQGAVARLEQLERTGELGADQKRLDAYRATGVLPNPGVTDWSWDDDGSTPW